MKWFELAQKLSWSQGYLSKVFHGYARPSEAMAEKARPVTRKTVKWWDDASQSEVQTLLNKLKKSS